MSKVAFILDFLSNLNELTSSIYRMIMATILSDCPISKAISKIVDFQN